MSSPSTIKSIIPISHRWKVVLRDKVKSLLAAAAPVYVCYGCSACRFSLLQRDLGVEEEEGKVKKKSFTASIDNCKDRHCRRTTKIPDSCSSIVVTKSTFTIFHLLAFNSLQCKPCASREIFIALAPITSLRTNGHCQPNSKSAPELKT